MTESSEDRDTDVCVLKLDQAGRVQWERTFGGSKNDEGCSIVQTSDGGYAIVGTTESFGSGGKDIYVLKLDADGQLRK
ncbi:MAG: hypothetical protein KatS3mg026_0112 [Bacteroidia bacterium]|nr:MAG: hypothetical protein KatS3mg026_0112 [Bacteroidia bacterium]